MLNTEILANDPDKFKKVFPYSHPLSYNIYRLRTAFTDDTPEELVPNDPNVPQNKKVLRTFWNNLITVLDLIIDEGLITNENFRKELGFVVDYYQNHRFKKDKRTKKGDINIANNVLDRALPYALYAGTINSN